MKFLVDQQLPPALVGWFERQGYEAAHVDYLGFGASSDRALWLYAQQNGFVVVTKDRDFATMRERGFGPQILWLRVGNATREMVLAHMDERWDTVLEYLEAGEPIVQA